MSRTFHHGNARKMELFGNHWKWMRGCPRWFSTMTKHRPQRAATRKALKETMLGKEADFPHDKKPIEYYW
jgi:hypothetical protein